MPHVTNEIVEFIGQWEQVVLDQEGTHLHSKDEVVCVAVLQVLEEIVVVLKVLPGQIAVQFWKVGRACAASQGRDRWSWPFS